MMKEESKSLFDKIKVGVIKTLSANVINKAISMISSMVITRLLTTNDYGVWSYVLNIYSYLLLVSGFGLISGALQFGTENKGEGKAYRFFKYCTKTGLIIDIVIISIFCIIVAFIQLPIQGTKPFVIVFLPVLLMEYINSIGQSILRSQNRIGEYANVLNINTILVTIGTCGGALIGLNGVIVGRYVAYFLSMIYTIWLLKADIKKINYADALDKHEKKQLWHYSVFTGASSAMNCLVYSLDITLIASLLKNANEVGIYRVGTLIPNALQFIPSSLIISILPMVIQNRDNPEWLRKNLKKSYLALLGVNALIVLFLFIASPFIIRLFSGEKYVSSIPVLRILSLGYFFSGTFRGMSVNLLAAFRRVRFGLFISIVSCVLDIVLNYFLINIYGMIGAAYATFVVDFVAAMISFIYFIFLIRKGSINENN